MTASERSLKSDDIVDDMLRRLEPYLSSHDLQRTAYELRQAWGGYTYVRVPKGHRAARKRSAGTPGGSPAW